MGCPQQTGGRETDQSVLLEPLPRDFHPEPRSNKMQDPCSGGKVTATWLSQPRADGLVSRAGVVRQTLAVGLSSASGGGRGELWGNFEDSGPRQL